MTPIDEYWLTYECECGYHIHGVVMDDPSCVRDTARSQLSIWRIEHNTTGQCRIMPFWANMRPITVIEIDQ